MKPKIFNILFIIGILSIVNAQNQNKDNKDTGVSCSISIEQSNAEKRILKKLRKKNYKSISRFLSSKNSDLQYLALITLENLEKLNDYKLTQLDKKRINLIKKSSELISICSNSNQPNRIELKKLLSSEFIKEIWLIRIFNSE
jgi:hypothetical protein